MLRPEIFHSYRTRGHPKGKSPRDVLSLAPPRFRYPDSDLPAPVMTGAGCSKPDTIPSGQLMASTRRSRRHRKGLKKPKTAGRSRRLRHGRGRAICRRQALRFRPAPAADHGQPKKLLQPVPPIPLSMAWTPPTELVAPGLAAARRMLTTHKNPISVLRLISRSLRSARARPIFLNSCAASCRFFGVTLWSFLWGGDSHLTAPEMPCPSTKKGHQAKCLTP